MSARIDYDRTFAFCESAVQRIRLHQHPAYPRNYELWYTYATGYNAALNRAINEALKTAPTITEQELDLLYETYLSPLRLSERVDSIGTRILAEIAEVTDILKDARAQNGEYTKTLERLAVEADGLGDLGRALGTIARTMLAATGEMTQRTLLLESQLASSQDEMQELHNTLEVIRAESLTDPLTGLANRKFLQGTLDRSIADAANGQRFSMLVIDIDHFKTFNDTYGHLTGDQVLRLVALALKQNVKGQDLASRFGGEEFAIILPDTALSGAAAVGDRIRRAVMAKDLVKRSTGEHLGRITVSVGVATWRRGDSAQTVIDRADRCMYAAKRAGRNMVVTEDDPRAADHAVVGKVA
ncbi:GGDEF domain-containing protein [Methylopila sp. M107]|uniref:GGDEF domain-containing protein n=1 Tax=Methylopila sp. M107 TaxID=1101190 RepID=UPI00035E7736|nr:GGDEF domain-containing protein [Methylopila sp. M107]